MPTKYENMKTYHDLAGEDGGSKILDQVGALQKKLKENLSGVGQLLAVGSGKGGVGKSTVTWQLALGLAARGAKVGVLDADFNGPSLARMAGLMDALVIPGESGFAVPKTRGGIKVLSFGTIIPEGETLEFANVSPGDSHIWRSTKEFATLRDLLSSAQWGELDYLLLDLPPGAERCYQYAQFLGKGAAFVLVSIPSKVAQGVVKRSRTALAKAGAQVVGEIHNMAGYFCADCGEVKSLFGHLEKEDLAQDFLGALPFDPDLARQCDEGTLEEAYFGSEAEKRLTPIVENILEKLNGREEL